MKIAAPETKPATRGRPRGFDRAAALETALRLFWRHGYEATSIADLSAAMAIAPASLYAAFGDKETLFIEVLGLYVTGPANYAATALARPGLRESLLSLIDGAAEAFSQPDWPHGCLATLGDTGLGPRSGAVGARMAGGRALFHRMIRDRIVKGEVDGDIASAVEAEDLAHAVLLVLFGLAVAARDNLAVADLKRAGHIALAGNLARLGLVPSND